MRFPKEWRLSPQQTKLAQALAKAPNGYRTRDQLLFAINKTNDAPSTYSSLSSGLSRLRHKTGIKVRGDYAGGCWIAPESQRFLKDAALR
jgi:DNA-binding response OmpR family regulator